jgi:hypothetical protein
MSYEHTMKCVKDSFTGSDWGSNKTNNTIIDAEIDYWKTYGAGIYPAVVINNRTYRGQLETLAVFNAICAGFETAPFMCEAILSSNRPDFLPQDEGISSGVIVAIVFLLILLNIIIVYCYRRYSKREMQNEM